MMTVWDSPPGWPVVSALMARALAGSSRGHFGCRAQHRAHHAVLRAAAAKVAVERFLDLAGGGRRISLQKRRCAHEDSRNAIAALQRLFDDERPLQRVRMFGRAQSLDRRDILALDRP